MVNVEVLCNQIIIKKDGTISFRPDKPTTDTKIDELIKKYPEKAFLRKSYEYNRWFKHFQDMNHDLTYAFKNPNITIHGPEIFTRHRDFPEEIKLNGLWHCNINGRTEWVYCTKAKKLF